MMTVELIYDHDCPNAGSARERLMRAFEAVGVAPRWSEWERSDPASPAHVRSYGSPTILVDGKDVAGGDPTDDISCCRLYADPDGGFQGAPSIQMIESALRTSNGTAGNDRS